MRADRIRTVYTQQGTIEHFDFIRDREYKGLDAYDHPTYSNSPTETVKRITYDAFVVKARYLPSERLGIVEVRLPDGADWIEKILVSTYGITLYAVFTQVDEHQVIRAAIDVFDRTLRLINANSPCPREMEGHTRPCEAREEDTETAR